MIRLAIVTVSDKASSGERADAGGPAIREALSALGVEFDEVDYRVVPDEEQLIGEALFHLSERSDVDLILTTGGTGLAPRDVTPQITLHSIDYEVPGIAEAMRAASLKVTPSGMLSRSVAGVRKRTLIINLPGSPKAVRENLEAISGALQHAVDTLRGRVGEHTA
jgi:molybdenum cofactor synthesis domain-containing protein